MPTFYFEKRFGRDEGRVIAGVDEVGRGPLAGPVVAAACIIPEKFPVRLARRIDDSKQLTIEEREELYALIRERCACSIAQAFVAEIDCFNILQASLLAMSRAVEGLRREIHPSQHDYYLLRHAGEPVDIHMVLVDGNRPPALSCPAHPIVGGDARSLSIAAASILAKVTRDRMMHALHEEFPHYGFNSHVGYSTPTHLAALRQHGPCIHHRQSFAPVREWKHLPASEVAA
ncbi:MAG TPA: ribonuclease HII [Alphaproteobacteria bacterium]|nr:ribonuclease HII [Alphaproteobacteria bacterium]